jgi:pantoate--beta-alanine ligase
MNVIHTISELKAVLSQQKAQGRKVGLVPTMGALHAGHASLVKRSVSENDVTVVSVFVNPTQFNDKNDLLKYPRTLDADCKLLELVSPAIIVFAPSVEEMYPEEDTRRFSYAPLDTVMEGAFRPGHFNGVCQIVSKLFMAVEPDRAYFGEKDFQQLAIIREMVKQMNFPIQIQGCPIVREDDGLALRIFHKHCSKVVPLRPHTQLMRLKPWWRRLLPMLRACVWNISRLLTVSLCSRLRAGKRVATLLAASQCSAAMCD